MLRDISWVSKATATKTVQIQQWDAVCIVFLPGWELKVWLVPQKGFKLVLEFWSMAMCSSGLLPSALSAQAQGLGL